MTTNPNHQREVLPDGHQASALGFEPFINKPEVARRLGKQVRTVDNWMQQGLLPYYKVGRSVAFKWSEVERQLRELQGTFHRTPWIPTDKPQNFRF